VIFWLTASFIVYGFLHRSGELPLAKTFINTVFVKNETVRQACTDYWWLAVNLSGLARTMTCTDNHRYNSKQIVECHRKGCVKVAGLKVLGTFIPYKFGGGFVRVYSATEQYEDGTLLSTILHEFGHAWCWKHKRDKTEECAEEKKEEWLGGGEDGSEN